MPPDHFLARTPPFDRLDATTLKTIGSQVQQLRYRMGQAIGEANLIDLPHHAASDAIALHLPQGKH